MIALNYLEKLIKAYKSGNKLIKIYVYFIKESGFLLFGGDADHGGEYACGEAGGMWEISVPFSQFCCEPNCFKKLS